MELSAEQCLTLAQIYPILLFAIAVEHRGIARLVPRRSHLLYRTSRIVAFGTYFLGAAYSGLAIVEGDPGGTHPAVGAGMILFLLYLGVLLALGAWQLDTLVARREEHLRELAKKKRAHQKKADDSDKLSPGAGDERD